MTPNHTATLLWFLVCIMELFKEIKNRRPALKNNLPFLFDDETMRLTLKRQSQTLEALTVMN